MIKEVQMFTVVCDNCGRDSSEEEDYSCWADKDFAEECAGEANWLKEGEKHYCYHCYYYDEDNNLVIKAIPKTNQ